MARRTIDNVKLGAFTIGGLLFLVLLLYMIGKNRNLFGDTYVLKARFENVQGLIEGNNVRYSGIETGTVKEIDILDDTTIEVVMVIDKKMQAIIRKNAVVTVGTEGFVGNKVVNIIPARQPAALALEGDVLYSKRSVNTDEMLQTLSKTNNDIAVIAAEMKATIHRINNSNGFWALMNDEDIPHDVRAALANIRTATGKANAMVADMQYIITDIKTGKGSAGILLKDSSFALNLTAAVSKINTAAAQADSLIVGLHQTIAGIRTDIDSGHGMVNALFKDSAMVRKVHAIMDNIQNGTDGFNQNMEALKHNFLFRCYFKKLEKQQKKAGKTKPVLQ